MDFLCFRPFYINFGEFYLVRYIGFYFFMMTIDPIKLAAQDEFLFSYAKLVLLSDLDTEFLTLSNYEFFKGFTGETISKVLALFGPAAFTELLCYCTTSIKLLTFFFFEVWRSIFFKSFGRFLACGFYFKIFSELLSYLVVTFSVFIMWRWLPLRLRVLFYKISVISIFLVSTFMLLKFEPYLAEFSNWLGTNDLTSLICEVIVS